MGKLIAAFALLLLVPSARAEDPVLLAAGDVAFCKSLDGAKATAAILQAHPGATVAVLGDLAYGDGSSQEFSECYGPTWGQFKDRTRPAPGNHDYHTPKAEAYFAYFGPGSAPGKGYYSYDLGGWHVLSLNSNCTEVGGCGAGSPEEAFVKADLAAHPGVCVLAYWHHPLFSSGVKPAHALHPEMRPIWQDLYDAKAAVILNGHEHNYERFAPQNPEGAPDPRGIREFVVGTGGKDFDPLGPGLPNSEVRRFDTFGVLQLTLHPKGYDWEFLPAAGGTFTDKGSGGCPSRP
jgi:hypothetical protein